MDPAAIVVVAELAEASAPNIGVVGELKAHIVAILYKFVDGTVNV
jgi:hypothetical protein